MLGIRTPGKSTREVAMYVETSTERPACPSYTSDPPETNDGFTIVTTLYELAACADAAYVEFLSQLEDSVDIGSNHPSKLKRNSFAMRVAVILDKKTRARLTVLDALMGENKDPALDFTFRHVAERKEARTCQTMNPDDAEIYRKDDVPWTGGAVFKPWNLICTGSGGSEEQDKDKCVRFLDLYMEYLCRAFKIERDQASKYTLIYHVAVA